MSCDGLNSKKSLCIIPVATSQHSISTVTPFNKRKCVAFGPLASSSFMGLHFSAQTLPACHTWVQIYPSSHHWIFNVHEILDSRFPGFLARIFGHSFDLHSNSIALPLKTLDTFAPRASSYMEIHTVTSRLARTLFYLSLYLCSPLSLSRYSIPCLPLLCSFAVVSRSVVIFPTCPHYVFLLANLCSSVASFRICPSRVEVNAVAWYARSCVDLWGGHWY